MDPVKPEKKFSALDQSQCEHLNYFLYTNLFFESESGQNIKIEYNFM